MSIRLLENVSSIAQELIKSCVKSLSYEAARTVVNSFVISRVDYCNSLLAGIPKCLLDRLQSVLNASAKLLCGCLKYDHVTPLIRDRLHWLPVSQRIEFKLCLLTYKSLSGMASKQAYSIKRHEETEK